MTDRAAYDERDAMLLSLGYRSYREYLASELWASIRERVFEERGRHCLRCCRAPAFQVHHREYTVANLSGESLRGLFPVCRGCHEAAERREGRLRGVSEANASLGLMTPGVEQVRRPPAGRRCKGCRRQCFGSEEWCPGCVARAAGKAEKERRRLLRKAAEGGQR